MKKIIISCAPAGVGTGSNLGMNTVDFAMENIVKEYKLENDVEINRPWDSYFKDKNGKYPKYKDYDFPLVDVNYNDFNLVQSDSETPKLIFYWGDFQHGKDFVKQTSIRLKRVAQNQGWNIEMNPESLIKKVSEYFLLKKFYDRGKLPFDVAMYGVTLFQNGMNDYIDDDYFKNLKWLYQNSIFAKSRESYSANMISRLKEDYKHSFLGVDCALLNKKEELLSLPTTDSKYFNDFEGKIGIFLGRSSKRLSRFGLVKFINSISKKTNKNVVNIPWGYFSGGLLSNSLGPYMKFVKKYSSPSTNNFTAGDILTSMSKLDFIITDTYHVAINAITLNIPVICIYEPSPSRDRDANMGHRYAWRDKRALLFQTNNMSDFLICSHDLSSSKTRSEKVDNLVNLLSGDRGQLTDRMYNNLHMIAKSDRKLIGNMLKEIASK